jgi:LysM repeat protein
MSKKVTITIVVIAIAVVLLFTACTRSAAQPTSLATPTTGNAANAESTPTSMSLVQAWGTSTAIYVQTAVAQGTFTAVPDASLSDPTATSALPATGVPVDANAPAATLVVVAPTATPGRPATYTLQKGEFPYCIARRFNVDPDALLASNSISSGEILQPGLVLNIPSTGSFPGVRALRAHPAQYTVAVDDTIYKIACYFGDIDPSAIAAANNLALTTTLTTGQVLNIP